MARHNRPISADTPTVISSSPQPTSVGGQVQTPQTIGGGRVYFVSYDAGITLAANLRGPVSSPLPQSKIDVIDRPLRVGLTTWSGRDPYPMTVPIQIGTIGGPSVEHDIDHLVTLALPNSDIDTPPASSIDALPRIYVVGPTPYPGLTWWISGITEVPERLEYNDAGYRCRFAADVALVEHTEDQRLTVGVSATTVQTAPMAKGESLTDLARRLYPGHPEKAKDIAKLNKVSVGFVAKADTTVRLPS